MAIPIKETPVLKGKVASDFLREIRKNENRKVPPSDRKRAEAVYAKVKSKNSFTF